LGQSSNNRLQANRHELTWHGFSGADTDNWTAKESSALSRDRRAPMLEIRGLQKSFGSLHALQGVSFSLAAGERLALLGPNGAGKTTLIRCLSGSTRADEGEIKLLGRPIDDSGIRAALGLVPQEIALYGDLTTRENLAAFAKFHGLRGGQKRERVNWALQWTGLAERANDLVGGFSGGMRRRVNLACGVMHSPQVLLLDEPTVGVDPQSRQRIFTMLDELSSGGTSIVLTTHQLDEAEDRSDRIVILDDGKVIADGTISQLVERSVGTSRLVRIRIDRPLSQPLTVGADGSPTVGWPGENHVSARFDDVSVQLPRLLDTVRDGGYEVSDVEVHAPTLHHVFLHLTGNELRD
jgi:ABC-2 type transport system ATP-binding protein